MKKGKEEELKKNQPSPDKPHYSYNFNVIATAITKLDIKTPVVMFYFLFKH